MIVMIPIMDLPVLHTLTRSIHRVDIRQQGLLIPPYLQVPATMDTDTTGPNTQVIMDVDIVILVPHIQVTMDTGITDPGING